jgi:hypothetical protein
VRTKVNKICAILTLGLLPAAVGCAAHGVFPSEEGINPGLPTRRISDGDPRKVTPGVLKIYLDPKGYPFPNPATHPLNGAVLASVDGDLQKYFKITKEEYDREQVFSEYADRLNEMTRDGKTLIVPIHGFNASLPEIYRSYKAVQRQVEHLYPNKPVCYLEVYWAGLYGDPFVIWPIAQRNSNWAGLGLRNLLGRLNPATPIRVLTHSRGASVICSALWNTDLRSNAHDDQEFRNEQQKLLPPVLPGLRMGLLAPAIRPLDIETYHERGTEDSYYHDRIILGINPDDHALNCGGFWWLMGTSLGCCPDQFETIVAPLLNRGRAHAFRVDFSGSVEHSFEDYVLRDVFEEEFLPKLLDDGDSSVVATTK